MMKDTALIFAYWFSASLILFYTLFYFFLKEKYTFWKSLGVHQHPPKMVFGNIKEFMLKQKSETEIIDQIYDVNKGRKYVGLFYFWKPELLILDPDIIKRIFINDFDYMHDHAPMSSGAKTDGIMHGLFFLKGEVWKERRQLFSKLFTPLRLKEFMSSINEQMQKTLPLIDEHADTGEDVYLEEVLETYTLSLITSTLFGIKVDCTSKESQFVQLSNLILHTPLSSVLKITWLTQTPGLYRIFNLPTFSTSFWNFFKPLVEELVSHREQLKDKTTDLVTFLIKLKEDLTPRFKAHEVERELIGQAFNFFAAGHHTTQLTLCHFLVAMSQHPDIQRRVREEVTKVLEENDGHITYEGLKKLTYTEFAINETLRMHPLLGVLKRKCCKIYRIDDKLTIPVGTEVIIPVSALHKDPKYFYRPNEFIPDRWEDGSLKASSVYLPFGKGPRICIGMRFAEITLKYAIVSLLDRYEFLPSDKMKNPVKYDPGTLIITGRPIDGFWVKIKKLK